MKNQKGFSLIELLIVVAIILIIAAIAIPSLMRARIASNESAMVGDIRTVVSAAATFQSAAGHYGDLVAGCLTTPVACWPAAGTILMVDTVIQGTIPKNGYGRQWQAGPATVPMPPGGANLIEGFAYGGTPSVIGRTGYKGFAADDSGVLCYTADGTLPAAGGQINAGCTVLGT